MTEIKTVRPSTRADYYECENLFPRASEFVNDDLLREYIVECMVELASKGRLYLTDVYNQSDKESMIAGMICLGQRIDPVSHQMITGVRLPQTLNDYRVKIRKIGENKIYWKDGMVDGEPIVKGRFEKQAGPACRAAPDEREVDGDEVELDIYNAWKCLKWCGAHWVKAKRKEQRDAKWKVEEVRPIPTGEVKEQKPVIRRGRAA